MEQRQVQQNSDLGLARFFSRVYANLGVAIAISAVSSYLVLTVFYVEVMTFFSQHFYSLFVLWAIQIGFVIYLGRQATKNPTMAFVGFIIYSILNGITLGITLSMYTSASIYKAFISASITYGVMAVIGTRTQKDLSGMGQALRGGLIGIIIVMLLNAFFFHSGPVELFISILTVVVFAGLTAYDHQMIKRMYAEVGDAPESKGLAVFCALQLYLDFINLLIAFVRIFGRN